MLIWEGDDLFSVSDKKHSGANELPFTLSWDTAPYLKT